MGPDARSARLSAAGTAALMILLAVGVAWLGTRFGVESDWTAAGRHTLSHASSALLDRLSSPLQITAYAREDDTLRTLVRRFVDRYQRHRADIELAFVNPDLVPDEVRSLGITVDGELVLRYQGRVEHVRSDSEQEFANALERLLRAEERWIAFIEGHGERSPVGTGGADLSLWAGQLRQRGYRFQPLQLTAAGTLPDNTSLVIIAGPGNAYFPGEAQILERYLEDGGNLLWLAEPGTESGLRSIAAQLGVTIASGTIIDTAGKLVGIDDPAVALVTSSLYGRHPLLAGFTLTTFFPRAGGLVPVGTTSGWRTAPLLATGSHTWLESGPLEGDVQPDPGVDRQGPITLGLAFTRAMPAAAGRAGREQRAVVIADGDFLSNTYVGNPANLELGMRIVNWLVGDDDLVSIPATTAADTHLEMDPVLLGSLGVLFLFLIPLGLLATGMLVWWRRGRL